MPIAILTACLLAAVPAAAREWTHKAGNRRIEADLVGFADGKAHLSGADNKIIVVPLDELSTEDVQFLTDDGLPALAADHYNHGSALLDAGKYDEAVTRFDAALALRTKYPEALTNRGIAHDVLGDYEKAVADYTAALAIDPRFATAYNNRAIAHHNRGQPEKALADYTVAIQLGPTDADALNGRGVIYTELGDTDKALADLTAAIKLDAEHASAYGNRANLLPAGRQRAGDRRLQPGDSLRQRIPSPASTGATPTKTAGSTTKRSST